MGDFRPAELRPVPGAESHCDVVDRTTATIDALGDAHHGMLVHYRERGISGPLAAHVATGETGDQHPAYGWSRSLRWAGFIRHAGRGKHEYALPGLVSDEYADLLGNDKLRETVVAIEASFVEEETDGK